jgi:serine/threonine protein kinase
MPNRTPIFFTLFPLGDEDAMRQAAAYVRWAYGHLSRSQRDAKEPAEYLVGRICEENSGHQIGVRGIVRVTGDISRGHELDSYEVVGRLGAGGMGEVYRARDPLLKRDVAIKALPAFVSQDPDRLHRFEREARAAAALNHPIFLPFTSSASWKARPNALNIPGPDEDTQAAPEQRSALF